MFFMEIVLTMISQSIMILTYIKNLKKGRIEWIL